MSIEIVHETDRQRFAARDGEAEVGELTYAERGDAIVIEHTIVDPARQGEGIAGRLAETALAELGEGSPKRIVPQCSYVARYVQTHPEHLPLTRRGSDTAGEPGAAR